MKHGGGGVGLLDSATAAAVALVAAEARGGVRGAEDVVSGHDAHDSSLEYLTKESYDD